MKTIKFKHSGNTGDIIYSLSVIKEICDKQKAKAVLYLFLDKPSTFTDKSHPVGSVMLNQVMFDMLKPLLESQPYILDVFDVKKEENAMVDIDLDKFREEYKNLSAGDIRMWYGNFLNYQIDMSAPVLSVLQEQNDYIVINRTQRYNNPLIDYSIIDKLNKKVFFVGTETEWKVMNTHFRCEHYKVSNFLEMAKLIAGSSLFVGNQSMAFAIAEQMKHPRILEQYFNAPNVIPQGGTYSVFHTQQQFESII
jgi:hypothetical protein